MPRLLCLILALVAVLPPPAEADPLAVTSGYIIFTDEPGDFLFAGSGFSIQGSWYPQTVSGTSVFDVCLPCLPGSALAFGVSTYTFSTDASAVADATINGVTYQRVLYDAQVTFQGPTVIAPTDGDRVSGPFSFTARMAAFAGDEPSGTPLFAADLQGSGTAHVFFDRFFSDPRALYVWELEYRFEDDTPVPEPSTLLLLATGLAAAAARRRG